MSYSLYYDKHFVETINDVISKVKSNQKITSQKELAIKVAKHLNKLGYRNSNNLEFTYNSIIYLYYGGFIELSVNTHNNYDFNKYKHIKKFKGDIYRIYRSMKVYTDDFVYYLFDMYKEIQKIEKNASQYKINHIMINLLSYYDIKSISKTRFTDSIIRHIFRVRNIDVKNTDKIEEKIQNKSNQKTKYITMDNDYSYKIVETKSTNIKNKIQEKILEYTFDNIVNDELKKLFKDILNIVK